jgi:hypothetical protein
MRRWGGFRGGGGAVADGGVGRENRGQSSVSRCGWEWDEFAGGRPMRRGPQGEEGAGHISEPAAAR